MVPVSWIATSARRQDGQEVLERRLVEAEIMGGVEEDEVRLAPVEVLRRDLFLRAAAEDEPRIATEEFAGDAARLWIDVECVQAGVGVERPQEVKGAVAAREPDLDHRP